MLFDGNHWHEVFQSLRRNRLRTILTACGVFWGVFMLVVMLGFGSGLEQAVSADFGKFAQNSVFVWGERTTKAFAGRTPGREIHLTVDDAEAIRTQVPGVEMVVPRNQSWGRGPINRVTRKDKSEVFELTGDVPEYIQVEAMDIIQGRWMNPDDLRDTRKVVVIGERVRDHMFDKGEDPIGQSLRVGSVDMTVIGVFRPLAFGGRAEWLSGRMFMPRTTYARTYGTGNRVQYLMVLVAAGHDSPTVEAAAKRLMQSRHSIHPEDTRGVGSFNRAKEAQKFHDLFFGISALSWVVGVLTLLAGAIGVSNIMMISVAERTKEIGIRKAIGATPMTIMVQIVTEATVLTALAGYLGLVFGVGVLEVTGRIVEALPASGDGPRFFTRPDLQLWKAVAATVVLTVSGALAGLAPARSAVSIRPVEALAHE